MKAKRTPAGSVRDYSYARQPRRTVSAVRVALRETRARELARIQAENKALSLELVDPYAALRNLIVP